MGWLSTSILMQVKFVKEILELFFGNASAVDSIRSKCSRNSSTTMLDKTTLNSSYQLRFCKYFPSCRIVKCITFNTNIMPGWEMYFQWTIIVENIKVLNTWYFTVNIQGLNNVQGR